MNRRIFFPVLLLVAAALFGLPAHSFDSPETAGVKGGVVVRIGCEDADALASLRPNDRYLVQGLDTDGAVVAKTRQALASKDLYGPVSVDRFDGTRLPYVDDFVNLIVADELGTLPMEEVLRVLVPNGVAMVGGKKTVKPWPADMDGWGHYYYDATGSCVGKDTRVGPPRRLRWVGPPQHARSHEHTASLHALVSANGRTFDVTDLGPKESIQLPSKYTLTARDAFNGTILWQREIPDWFNHLYPLKSGPAYMPRRLVAVGDVVYVSGGVGHDMLALDAVTGKVLREYEGTATAVDLIVSEGVLFVVVDGDRKPVDYKQESDHCWNERDRASNLWAWRGEKDRLRALQAETGEALWEVEAAVMPLSLTADGSKVCYHDGSAVVALDRGTGEKMWASGALSLVGMGKKGKPGKGAKQKRAPQTASPALKTGYAPRLILHEEVVLYSPFGSITALDGKTGKPLWQVNKTEKSGHFTPEDLFVIDGIVWAAHTARGKDSTFGGYDLKTGEKVKHCPNPVKAFYMHQRCYPGRATEKWLIPAASGTEFVDPKTGSWEIHHWVRGGCIYGMMPANGLLYCTPQACACYYQSKMNGFNALAAGERDLPEKPAGRLEKGPAWGKVDPASCAVSSGDWSTFRSDNERSGCVAAKVSSDLKTAWRTDLGGKISQATTAGGLVFLAAVDRDTVLAIDAATGKEVWSFIAGGRVDSPPTIHEGLAIFGSADGHVYAVAARTGELAWRYRAAPIDERMMSYGRIESVWPVHGSTLIQDGTLYVTAGRSVFLDGGLRVILLDPLTGEMISEAVLDDKVPGTEDNLQAVMKRKHMPVALPDILSSDGKFVYMKSQTFDMEGNRTRIEPQAEDVQEGEEQHLFAPISFLDGSWFHRAYWIYGRAAGEGWAEWQIPGKHAPYGRILVFDKENVYGYGRDPEYLCNSSLLEYRLYCAGKKVNPGKTTGSSVTWKKLAAMEEEKLTRLDFQWKVSHPPFLVRAMALAGEVLFVAGPPDVADEKALWGRSNDTEYREKMALQAAAFRGEQGAILRAVSKKDGSTLSEIKLDYLPAFDGMIAADGRLLVSTAEGSLVCYEGK